MKKSLTLAEYAGANSQGAILIGQSWQNAPVSIPGQYKWKPIGHGGWQQSS